MRTHRWPALDHLLAMTDDVGLLQHATLDVPNRSCGYCTDDVGRALIVACDAAARRGTEADGARLVTTYLAYLHDAQLPDGSFHDFMGYDRRWQDDTGTPDAVGRAIWGLGYAERHAPRDTWRAVAGRMRAQALAADPGDGVRPVARVRRAGARARARDAARRRVRRARGARRVARDDRRCVRRARRAGLAMVRGHDDLRQRAPVRSAAARRRRARQRALRRNRARDARVLQLGRHRRRRFRRPGAAIFVPVGNDGWYPRGGVKARYGQQPLEAAAMVDAAFAALDITGDERWRGVAEIAHEWFFGGNTQHVAGRDRNRLPRRHRRAGVNGNMGAESTVCYLMSAIALANRSTTSLHAVR